MRSLRIATIIAAGLLALASADAGAQHAGAGRAGSMQGGGMHGGGRVHGPVGPHVGTFPNHGGFRSGGFRSDGFRHDGFRHDGRFVHGFHGGQLGWWWVAGGLWYPWPQYAYATPVYVAPVYSNVYYYCASAAAYYPNVTDCPEGWMPVVPATPAY